MSSHRGLGVGLILGAACLWGTFGLFGKKLFSYGYTPIELASLRTWIAWALLALIMLVQRKSVRIAWRDLPFYIAYALFAFALFQFLYFETLELAPVAVAAALIYTAPAFVLLISAAFGTEKLNLRRVGLLLLTLLGVVLVTGAARIIRSGAAIPMTAIVLGLAAGFTYALYTLFSKRGVERYDAMRNMFWVFALSSLALAIPAPPWTVMGPVTSLPWLLGIAVLPTLIAYLLYVKALEFTDATTASMLATAEPVVAAILGALVLGEATGTDSVIGIALIVLSAVLLVRQQPEVTGSH